MGVEVDRYEALRCLARRYVWDGLSFWDALNGAARLDPAHGIEVFKSSALCQFERALDAARAENRQLRAEIKELEHRLDPLAAEEEAFEHEMESRLAREREVEAERRACA